MLAHRTFSSLRTLARSDRRPCRVCALEPVLDHALRPRRALRSTFATFTSQPAYVADERRFRKNDVSETGTARLDRIARRLDLRVAASKIGPVAYGFLPAANIDVLSRNLRTLWTDNLTELPSPHFVSAVWTFTDDAPPEFGEAGLDVWETAALLVA